MNKILANELNVFVIVYLDDILIYMGNLKQAWVNTIYWILDILKKYDFFYKFQEKCLYKNKFFFLSYIVLTLKAKIKNKEIKVLENWFELKLA